MTPPNGTLIIAQNVANLYAEPDTASEMVSQTVLSDHIVATEEQNGFQQVQTSDRYQGWLAQDLLLPVYEDPDTVTTTITTLFADVYSAPDAHSEMLTKLVVTTRVVLTRRAGIGDWVPVTLPGNRHGYIHKVSLNLAFQGLSDNELQALLENHPKEALIAALGRQIGDTAKRFIGTPYLWGGCTPFGIDCSGLTQLVYKLNGIGLLRDAGLQFADRRFRRVEKGQALETALLEDGDLVFFSRHEDRRPTHVGIALGDGRFLHARGGRGVRIDDCDSPVYEETYLGATRLSPNADFAIEAA